MCWPKPLPSQRGQNMQLNICWRIIPHASDDTKCTSTCDEQMHPMLARKQNASQHVLTKPSQASEVIKCISTYVHYTHVSVATICIWSRIDQNLSMPARTQNATQHVLTKPIPCQRGLKMYLNMCWTMTSMTENASQHVLTKMPART